MIKKIPGNKRLAVTLGDPAGIGPEVIVKSLAGCNPPGAIVAIGDSPAFPKGLFPPIKSISDADRKGIFHFPVPLQKPKSWDSSQPYEPSYEFVKTAIEFALAGDIHALVTGPIAKEKWHRAGITFSGHTELLAHTAGVKDHCMFFWSHDLKVALYTVHIPLSEIFGHLRIPRIVRFTRFIDMELTRWFNKKFAFLFSGLNPHAGEDGFLGKEEKEIIIPAMEILRNEDTMDVQGPFPPDTIFLKARDLKDSVVISWYHDQGLIAFKLLNIHTGVNMTLGLPYIRTSPDHGTAFDIAGKGIANPSSMTCAIDLAQSLLFSSPS